MATDDKSIHSDLFKNDGKNFDTIRRNRQTDVIQLRKSKRDDFINKKRHEMTPTKSSIPNSANITTLEQIRKLVQECSHSDPMIYQNAILTLRLHLSVERISLLDELLELHIADILATHLHSDEIHEVRYNATWALTNIASGTTHHTAYLLRDNIIIAIGSMLTDPSPSLIEQAIWALSNIIGDGPEARCFVLKFNLLPVLSHLISTHYSNVTLIKQLSWLMINICRKKEREVPVEYLSGIIPILSTLLDIREEHILSDTLWAVTHLADSSHEHVSMTIKGCILEKTLPLIGFNQRLSLNALRACGNIAASLDEHTQFLLDIGLYTYLKPILTLPDSKIRKELYWLLSNIAAGTHSQMMSLFSLDIFPQVIRDLEIGENLVQREACWVICNVMHSCGLNEAQMFIDANVLAYMNRFLTQNDVSMQLVVLEAILMLLKLYTTNNQQPYICQSIEECGLIDVIENLQFCKNKTILNYTFHILETYFSPEFSTDTADELMDSPSISYNPNTMTTGTLPTTEKYDF